jgi:hypothetical protein
MPTRTTIDTQVQWGPEASYAAVQAAATLFDTMAITPGVQTQTQEHQPQGVKVNTMSDVTEEWTESDMAGRPSYTAEAYIWGSIAGVVSPTTIGTAGKQWDFTEDGLTVTTPQSYTLEHGNANRAGRILGNVFTDYGFKWTRKSITSDGKLLGQKYVDGISRTASPSRAVASPVQAGELSVFIDTTSGGLGTTQYKNVFAVDFAVSGKYGPKWTADPTALSFAEIIEMADQKWSAKIKAESDTTGMNPLTWMRAGQTVWLRLNFQGGLLPGEGATNYTYRIDMACKVGKPSKFEDESGVYALEWELMGVRDHAWGALAKARIINKLAALA